MKFTVSTDVPVHTWVNDADYLSFPIIDNGIYSKRISVKKYDFQS